MNSKWKAVHSSSTRLVPSPPAAGASVAAADTAETAAAAATEAAKAETAGNRAGRQLRRRIDEGCDERRVGPRAPLLIHGSRKVQGQAKLQQDAGPIGLPGRRPPGGPENIGPF